MQTRPLWKQPVLRHATGGPLRPGGTVLTDRAALFTGMLPHWKVLDIGCGHGDTLHHLRARYGATAYGIDVSHKQLTTQHNASLLPYTVQASGEQLPFAAHSFHAVFCECALSLFAHPKTALKEWYRILKPAGFLVITDVHTPAETRAPQTSCAEGAMPLSVIDNLVQSTEFTPRLWEDHTKLLTELSAKLIFAGCTCSSSETLGYYLLIAQKKDKKHAG